MKSRLLLTLFSVVLLAACESAVKLDDSASAQIENRPTDATATEGAAGANGSDATSEGVSGQQSERSVTEVAAVEKVDPLNEPDSLLSQRSIFFGYDSFTISPEFQPVVAAHARYLAENPDRKIVLQGNTDERGSREYNLALGQKRAEAVRRALAVLGVSDAQVEAVSFGEERPKSIQQNEVGYAENRRTDIIYQ